MNKIISLLLLFCLFSCNQTSKKERVKELNNIKTTQNEIVLIFKNKENNSLVRPNENSLKGDIFYTEKGNFIVNELKVNNITTSDTITIPIIADRISLSHKYNKIRKEIYEFQKGDTVVFNYNKGYPLASILNRKTLKYDNNFISNLKLKKPLNIFEFMIKNRRLRSKNEKEIYLVELNKYTTLSNIFLDSIFKKGLISKGNYTMYKGYNHFFQINTNPNLLKGIKEKDLKKDELLYIKTYRYFLNKYAIFKFKLKTEFTNDPMSCNSKIAFDSIEKSSIFSKRVKENLLYSHLINIANKNSDQDFQKYFDKFQTIIKDTIIINKIKNNYLLDFTSLKKEINEVYITDINKKNETLKSLISKNKGKVIFIDFWASWCIPCIKQIPFSKALKKEYQNKEITFVYLSIDKDFEKWRETSLKEEIIKNNFLAINYPNADFYKKLRISSIPRYLIYDKNGELVHKKAPHPESNEIRKEINKYLAQ
ncbi:TlpA family protein disulfide reductase [Tenacibaculum ovolyticum]|uniref:TlpA family protein disulfide reductase n=1 Tax=Tenacibaculum ovolyticum TaxID=104270 RepID=UPI003BAB604C